MSQILKFAVTVAVHPGSEPIDKQIDKHAGRHIESAVFTVAAKVDSSAASASETDQAHSAAACTSLSAVIPAMVAIGPSASSSQHYKIAAEFLKAGIHYPLENHSLEKHLRQNPVTQTVRAATALPQTDIILHLIDSPAVRFVFNGKLTLLNRVCIDNEQVAAENHRSAGPDAIACNPKDHSRKDESGLFIFRRRDQHQPSQGLAATIRGCA